MAQIQPINFPFTGEATQLKVLILNFETTATTCTTYNELLTDDEFAAWGEDNTWIENCVAKDKGIIILTY